ncbi:MAG: hypothetical protein WDZ70_01510 [Candidatus Paceibacterota bacterium]
MTKEQLAQAGALLYVCEGAKLRKDPRYKNTYIYAIDFTNSNPRVIALFMRFVREVLELEEERVKGQLFIYPDHNEGELVEYWSNVSKIPKVRFQKVIKLKQKNSRYSPNKLGTFKVRYTGKEKFLKMQEIIEQTWRDGRVVECATLE